MKTQEIKEMVRNPYSFPGGYELILITTDGGILCGDCVKSEYGLVYRSTRDRDGDWWEGAAVTTNWEDENMFCDHCGRQLAPEYGNGDGEGEE